MAFVVMAYIGMAYVGMTYIVMAYIVMAYIVMVVLSMSDHMSDHVSYPMVEFFLLWERPDHYQFSLFNQALIFRTESIPAYAGEESAASAQYAAHPPTHRCLSARLAAACLFLPFLPAYRRRYFWPHVHPHACPRA